MNFSRNVMKLALKMFLVPMHQKLQNYRKVLLDNNIFKSIMLALVYIIHRRNAPALKEINM